MSNPNTLTFNPNQSNASLAHEERMLSPGYPEVLSPNTSLSSPEENVEVFGLGFNASLRCIIQLSPDDQGGAAEELYIFDRGDNAPGETIANTPADKTNMFLRPDFRYVVFTQSGIEQLQETVAEGSSFKQRVGYEAFQAGATARIGRSHQNFNQQLSREVSGGHVDITFFGDGSIEVTDIYSTNGTRVILPINQPGNYIPQETRTVLPHVTETKTSAETTDLHKEFMLGKNVCTFEGAVNLGKRGDAYVFTSTDEAGKQRKFFVYKSVSEGGFRSSQGIAGGAYIKGGEWARRVSHYTQETQLHPDMQVRIDNAASRPANSAIGVNAIPQLDDLQLLEAQKDFAELSTMYALPDKNLYEVLAPLRPGELLNAKVIKVLGLPEDSSNIQIGDAMLAQIDKINQGLEQSGLIPDFSVQPLHVRHDTHDILGDVKKETYVVMKDGRPYEWVIASAGNGQKVWIDRIRLGDTKPTAYGTDAELIDSGILTSKPIEYDAQCEAVPEGYKNNVEFTHYTEITPFLSLLSPIKKYKLAKGAIQQ
jgi:hypothetical protein